MKHSSTGRSSVPMLIACILFCEMAGFLGSWLMGDALVVWYPRLVKPVFAPPGYVIGIVWTILFFLMGMSLYRAWLKRIKLKWFYIQLGLNVLWSYLFFGIREIGLAYIEILVLFAAIFATIYVFGQKDKLAARLLWPYWAWVGFASVLNLGFWLQN